ncbi:MAG TPA: hypothetical protein VFX96_12500 [Pyrinomonadaceae bacterium]|nr:hypothetical protein [Pyrinomonadaceae bacterium]
MKNSLAALLVMAFFALGCGLDKLAGVRTDSNSNANTSVANANTNTNASATPALASMNDTLFAETAFKSLTSGDSSAEWMVDWDSFRVADVDVGSQYRAMPGDTAKGAFRTSFISTFANSFKQTGAQLTDVSGWKEQSRAGDTTTVVGKIRNGKSIRLTVTHKDGRQGLASIDVD